MRVSWRNLEWIPEEDRGAIEQRLKSWSEGDRGLDRVDFVGPAPSGTSGDLRSSAAPGTQAQQAPQQTRVVARVGKAQITVVREAASAGESFRLAFEAFEDSARWALRRADRAPGSLAYAGAGDGVAEDAGARPGLSALASDSWARLTALQSSMLRVPVAAGALAWRALPRFLAGRTQARATRRTGPKRSGAGRATQRRAGANPRTRRVRRSARSWRSRLAPVAAAIAAFLILDASSALAPLSWLGGLLPEGLQTSEPAAFSALAGAVPGGGFQATSRDAAFSATTAGSADASAFRAVAVPRGAFASTAGFDVEAARIARKAPRRDRERLSPPIARRAPGAGGAADRAGGDPSPYWAIAGGPLPRTSRSAVLFPVSARSR